MNLSNINYSYAEELLKNRAGEQVGLSDTDVIAHICNSFPGAVAKIVIGDIIVMILGVLFGLLSAKYPNKEWLYAVAQILSVAGIVTRIAVWALILINVFG